MAVVSYGGLFGARTPPPTLKGAPTSKARTSLEVLELTSPVIPSTVCVKNAISPLLSLSPNQETSCDFTQGCAELMDRQLQGPTGGIGYYIHSQASSRPMCSCFVLGVRDRGPQEGSPTPCPTPCPTPSWDLELTQDSITLVLFLLFTCGDSSGTLSLTAWFTLSYT